MLLEPRAGQRDTCKNIPAAFFPSGRKEIAMDQEWSDVRNRAGKREFLSRTGEKKRRTA